MSENSNLRIISQTTDVDDCCDIEHLKSWIQTLPTHDLEQSSKMLLGAIRNLSSKCLSISDRMSALDMLRLSVKRVNDGLSRSLLEQGVSLSENMRASSVLVQKLHSVLIDGYKRYVSSLQKMQKDTRIQLAQALHRSVSEALELLLFKYQLYHDVPCELWGDINYLYLLAEKLELQNVVIEDNTNQFIKHSSILKLMIQAQLLALSQPYALKREDLTLVYRSLEYWSGYVYFDRIHKAGALFQIDLCSIQSADYVKIGFEKDSLRYIDVSKLVRNLFEVLHHNIPKSGFVLPEGMNSHLITHLCHCWGNHLNRKFHRSQIDASVSVCIGMLATHSYVKNQEKLIEVYRHASLDKAEKTFLERQLEVTYPSYSMSISNIGFGGLCLVCKGEVPSCVEVGELISVCFNQNKDWLLGVIRWIHIHPNQTAEIGVSILSYDLDVGFIKLEQLNDREQSLIPAIRLVTIDCAHSDMVIVPRGCINNEALIGAHFVHKKGAFCLKKTACTYTSFEFEIFYLEILKENNDYLDIT